VQNYAQLRTAILIVSHAAYKMDEKRCAARLRFLTKGKPYCTFMIHREGKAIAVLKIFFFKGLIHYKLNCAV